jgi:HKD family nuclease
MAPDLRFRGQPFDGDRSAGEFLKQALTDPAITRLTVVVAWARFGGLHRLTPELEAFAARGGQSRIIAGIDEGGATRPGLLMAIRLFTVPYVFHDKGARTFHPKIYLAESGSEARVLIGSSNATAGGLFSNYEANLEARFSIPAEEADPALVDLRGYIDALINDTALCRLLDAALVDELVINRRYRVSGKERRSRIAGDSLPNNVDTTDVDSSGSRGGGDATDDLFGSSVHSKAAIPAFPPGGKELLGSLEVDSGDEYSDDGAQVPSIAPAVVEAWDKTLPHSDAQRSPAGNATGNLRLVQAGHDIDQRVWFRRVLFGGVVWTPTMDSRRNNIEEATVPMDTSIGGKSYGVVPFRLTHASHRESSQNNHTTVLHWGSLAADLRAVDHTGEVVTIERLSDGTFRLNVS